MLCSHWALRASGRWPCQVQALSGSRLCVQKLSGSLYSMQRKWETTPSFCQLLRGSGLAPECICGVGTIRFREPPTAAPSPVCRAHYINALAGSRVPHDYGLYYVCSRRECSFTSCITHMLISMTREPHTPLIHVAKVPQCWTVTNIISFVSLVCSEHG